MAQAAEILAESDDRADNPRPVERRSSEDTVEPLPEGTVEPLPEDTVEPPPEE
jgi:hypothetical protein